MENVSLLAAFVAGLLSFISPCVLPLVPGYLSFVSGVTIDDMRAGTGAAVASRRRVLLASTAFVLGFSVVFIALGASASAIGQFVMSRLTLLGKVAGVILIVFGLHTMGILKVRWLYKEKRLQTRSHPAGPLGAFVVGLAFGFGWTPCIGPILAAILAVAAAQNTVAQGVQLLAVYSMGLGVPFLLTSVAVNRFFAAFAHVRRYFHAIEIASGALMIGIGVLIFSNRFTIIAQYLTPYLPTY
jgi:cytochrome c-type biogenesis protein